jgi:hypothetical protein
MGGGGNDNSMMMMMMMQQQQASAERQSAADKLTAEQRAAEVIADREAKQKQALQEHDWTESGAARTRQQQLDDRAYQDMKEKLAQQKIFDDKAAADKLTQDKLDKWNASRGGTYSSVTNEAEGRLSSMGISDPGVRSAVMSSLSSANAGIPELASNVNSYFDGIVDKVLGQQQDAARTKAGQAISQYLPNDFEQSRVTDDIDNNIIEGILGDQYNEASATAKRLLDRGVISQEGYAANLQDLGKQRNAGRVKLSALGDTELQAERGRLANIANQGRAAASQYTLGSQAYDPQKYVGQVNSAYDKWFAGLGDTLRGIAPSDLFDTSGFVNKAGSTSGPTNSPFVGTSNALTGVDALNQEEEKKKKAAAASGDTPAGVF